MFDIYGVVIDVDRFRKYTVKTDNGRILIRNRRFIRKRVPNSFFSQNHSTQSGENNFAVSSNTRSRPYRNVRRPRRLIEEENWP